MNQTLTDAAAVVRQQCALEPKLGLILGTGLGDMASSMDQALSLPNRELPGFPVPSVSSHAGYLRLGLLDGTPAAILDGRVHYYEHGQVDAMRVPIQTLAELGCQTLVLTNSAGSLRKDVGPGALMLISDHINLFGNNPLIGEQGDERFVDLTDAYDPQLRAAMREAAARRGVELSEGVYCWFPGPGFETPAEIRAVRGLGADAVGMSTVPETLLARRFGMTVLAISMITNLAAGMSEEKLTHEQSKTVAAGAGDALLDLLTTFAATLTDG